MVKIAFYKKPGTLADKIIRWRTGSIYSHCEMVVDDFAYTSSNRDSGVRARYAPDYSFYDGWDVFNLPGLHKDAVLDFYNRTAGAKYDYIGALLGQGLRVNEFHHDQRYFCSEWCAHTMKPLGIQRPESWSPGKLAAWVATHTEQ